MKLQDLLKDIELGKVYTDKDRKPFKVNEDGHTDVPSAIRKLKLSIEDSEELLKKLESMDKESSLPAWWTDKITLASNYLNKSRDYLLNSKVEEGKLNENYNKVWNNWVSALDNFEKATVNLAKYNSKVTADKVDERIILQNFKKYINPFYNLMKSWKKGKK